MYIGIWPDLPSKHSRTPTSRRIGRESRFSRVAITWIRLETRDGPFFLFLQFPRRKNYGRKTTRPRRDLKVNKRTSRLDALNRAQRGKGSVVLERRTRGSNFWIATWWNSIRTCDPASFSPKINALVSLNGAYTQAPGEFRGARRDTRTEDTTRIPSWIHLYAQTAKLSECRVRACISAACAATYGRGYARESVNSCTHVRSPDTPYTYIRTALPVVPAAHGVYYSQV